eukprot:NODE_93_length_21530_cov_0.700387.p13 type:complete len:205 gc:universal NODE_93_length_21530_cov_0.700387:13836-13222(-)
MKKSSTKSLSKIKSSLQQKQQPWIVKLSDCENSSELKTAAKQWLVKLSKLCVPDYENLVQALQDEWEKMHAVDLPDYSSGESLYLDASEEALTDGVELEIAKAKVEIESGRFVMGHARLMKMIHTSIKARILLGLFLILDENESKIIRGVTLLLVGIQQGLNQNLNEKEKKIIREAVEQVKLYIHGKHHQDLSESLHIIHDLFQ